MVYFGGFFSQTGMFAGFSLHIINLAVRISTAVMAGDIILFSIYYSPEGTAKLRLVGRGGGGGGEAFYFLGCRIA